MFLKGNQITSLFEEGYQTGITNRTWVFLQEEVITTVSDIVDFLEDEIWHQVVNNCKCTHHVAPSEVGVIIPQ